MGSRNPQSGTRNSQYQELISLVRTIPGIGLPTNTYYLWDIPDTNTKYDINIFTIFSFVPIK